MRKPHHRKKPVKPKKPVPHHPHHQQQNPHQQNAHAHQHHRQHQQQNPHHRQPQQQGGPGHKPPKGPKPPKHPRHLTALPAGTGWLLGGNDRLGTCAAVAVANHRLWATGQAMTGQEILALHEAAGCCLEDVLAAAGCEYWPAAYTGPGALLGVDVGGPHAVLAVPGGWVSWGGLIRPAGVIEEAWWVEWHDHV